MKLKREITVTGSVGLILSFVVSSRKGAVVFRIIPGWGMKGDELTHSNFARVTGFGWHARAKGVDRHPESTDSCQFIGGAPCSFTPADEAQRKLANILFDEGPDPFWDEMERLWISKFGNPK